MKHEFRHVAGYNIGLEQHVHGVIKNDTLKSEYSFPRRTNSISINVTSLLAMTQAFLSSVRAVIVLVRQLLQSMDRTQLRCWRKAMLHLGQLRDRHYLFPHSVSSISPHLTQVTQTSTAAHHHVLCSLGHNSGQVRLYHGASLYISLHCSHEDGDGHVLTLLQQ